MQNGLLHLGGGNEGFRNRCWGSRGSTFLFWGRSRGGGGSGVFKVRKKLHDGSREKRSEKTGQGQVVGKPESQGRGLG